MTTPKITKEEKSFMAMSMLVILYTKGMMKRNRLITIQTWKYHQRANKPGAGQQKSSISRNDNTGTLLERTAIDLLDKNNFIVIKPVASRYGGDDEIRITTVGKKAVSAFIHGNGEKQ